MQLPGNCLYLYYLKHQISEFFFLSSNFLDVCLLILVNFANAYNHTNTIWLLDSLYLCLFNDVIAT